MARRRQRWINIQPRLDPARLVFIDETWIKTNMAPLRGWAPIGERLIAHAPHGRWRTLTFLAALRCDGVTAPCVIDGPINGELFFAYIEQILLATLRPHDIVMIDNLASHKSHRIREAILSVRAGLAFLPAYSPDLNPIEQMFAKLKHWMRIAQNRTIEEIYKHVANILETIQPQECANYFENAGYASN